MMEKQTFNQVLYPIRVTAAFREELIKAALEAGVPTSVFVRSSIEIVLHKQRADQDYLSECMKKRQKEHSNGE